MPCPRGFFQQPVCTFRHQYIQFNYSHDISVDDIAKAVGVSRSHLYRVFMANVGQSPIDYLTNYRISEASRPAEKFQSLHCGDCHLGGIL